MYLQMALTNAELHWYLQYEEWTFNDPRSLEYYYGVRLLKYGLKNNDIPGLINHLSDIESGGKRALPLKDLSTISAVS